MIKKSRIAPFGRSAILIALSVSCWPASAQISQYPDAVISAQLAQVDGRKHVTCGSDSAYYEAASLQLTENIDLLTSTYAMLQQPILRRRAVSFIDGRDQVRLAAADKLLRDSCAPEAGAVYREVVRSSKDIPNQNRAMLGVRDVQDQQRAEATAKSK